LNRLEKVVTQHPQASQVIRVATDLHRQLTTIIATSADDPLRLDVVKQLLSVEQKVLEGNRAPGATLALAESRQVTQLLNKTTGPLGPVLHSSTSTSPTATTRAPHQNATHHRTTKSLRHHSSSSVHRHNSTRHKHPTDTSTPSPTPSSPVFGNGLFNTVL
jgi:hypothetical protein